MLWRWHLPIRHPWVFYESVVITCVVKARNSVILPSVCFHSTNSVLVDVITDHCIYVVWGIGGGGYSFGALQSVLNLGTLLERRVFILIRNQSCLTAFMIFIFYRITVRTVWWQVYVWQICLKFRKFWEVSRKIFFQFDILPTVLATYQISKSSGKTLRNVAEYQSLN